MTIPSHIGQYRILKKLGAGGMGLVYLGEHTLLGRRAAIKTLLPVMSANREVVERFFNEARATSAISDPGVIQVFDFGYHVDGTAYIVMELLEGEALSARIERLGKLAVGEALRIARQIAGSLAAAHAHDIVHRDLKPENIFLVADSEAQGGERTKILDFGVCKIGAGDPALTQAGAMIGTPVYMSPEQCRGASSVDHRADIYAFGCLLFHMLTGRPPFLGDASGELVVAHLEEEPPAPSLLVAELPAAVDAVVLRCMAKAPGDRHASMCELQAVLGDLYAELGSPEPSVSAMPSSMPLGRGFRSIYDGNRAGAEPLATSGRLPWLRLAPTPDGESSPSGRGTGRDTGEDDREDARHAATGSAIGFQKRGAVRAAFACVLVAGVVVGLVTTSFVVYGADASEESGAPAPAAVRAIERAQAAALAIEPTVVPGAPGAPDASSASAPSLLTDTTASFLGPFTGLPEAPAEAAVAADLVVHAATPGSPSLPDLAHLAGAPAEASGADPEPGPDERGPGAAERSAAPAIAAAPSSHDSPGPAADPDGSSASEPSQLSQASQASQPSGASSPERSRRLRDAAREMKPQAKPRQHPTPPEPRSTTRPAAAAIAAPPPVAPPAEPAPQRPPASTPAAPAAPPPPEDLYDTR